MSTPRELGPPFEDFGFIWPKSFDLIKFVGSHSRFVGILRAGAAGTSR